MRSCSATFLRVACLASALSLTAAPLPAQQRAPTIDVSGWGSGKVQPIATDPGRPWGWAVRAYMDNPDLPLYNAAKAKLLSGEQVFSHTISSLDIERYCRE